MARGGQGVQHDHREIRQPGEERLAGQADLRRVSHHQSGSHQGLRILPELEQQVFDPLLDTAAFTEKDHRILRQIVRAAVGVRVDQVQVAVQTVDLRAVPETLGVSPEGLGRSASLFLSGVFRRQLFQLLRQMRRAAGGQLRQDLRRRQQQGGGHVFRPPLGAGVEQSQRVDLIVEKLAAHRLLHQGGEHVQNPTPEGKLPHALHLIAAGVARLHQLGGQPVQIRPSAGFQRNG